MPGARANPYPSFSFTVEVGGAELGGFSEVELPGGRIAVIEYREGGDGATASRLLPGRVAHEPVVLRRGLAGDPSLYDWWRAVRDGTLDVRDVAITLRDEQGSPVQRWRLRNAWPTRLAYGTLAGLGNEIVLETLELVYESFETEAL